MDWAGSTRSAPLFAFGVNFLFQSFSVSVEISLMDWWSELSIQDRWKLVCSICGVSYGVCIQVNYSWLKLLLGWSKHVITLSCIIIVFSSYLSRCISPSLRTCCWSLCWGTVLVLFFLLGISFLTTNFFMLPPTCISIMCNYFVNFSLKMMTKSTTYYSMKMRILVFDYSRTAKNTDNHLLNVHL